VGKDKKVAHVPLNDVLNAKLPKLFPVQKEGTKPLSSAHVPTASNAGRGADHAIAEMPKLPALPVPPAHEEAPAPKKDNEKDPQPKKDPQPPEGKK
jgi:hypothetical protein